MKNPIVKMTLANVCKGDSRAHVMSPLSFLLFFFIIMPNSEGVPSASVETFWDRWSSFNTLEVDKNISFSEKHCPRKLNNFSKKYKTVMIPLVREVMTKEAFLNAPIWTNYWELQTWFRIRTWEKWTPEINLFKKLMQIWSWTKWL